MSEWRRPGIASRRHDGLGDVRVPVVSTGLAPVFGLEVTLKAFSDFGLKAGWTARAILSRHVTRKDGIVTYVSPPLATYACQNPELFLFLKKEYTKEDRISRADG